MLRYCIISFDNFLTISTIVKCKFCDSDISFSRNCEKGLGFQLVATCDCRQTVIDSCKKIGKAFEINRKFVFVMRPLGIGINGVKLFVSLMDLGTDFCNYTYYGVLENIKIAVDSVKNVVLQKAGNEEKTENKNHNLPDELTVSGDGTWAKRGFSSLIGICLLIGKWTGKVPDTFVSSKTCKTCVMKKKVWNPTSSLSGMNQSTKKIVK